MRNNKNFEIAVVGVFAALTMVAYLMTRIIPIRFTFIITTVFALFAADLFGKRKGFLVALALAVTTGLLTIMLDGDMIHPIGILTDYTIPFAITAFAALLPKKNTVTIIAFSLVAFFAVLMSLYITWAVAWFSYDWETGLSGPVSFGKESWTSFWAYQATFVFPTIPTILIAIVAPYQALKVAGKDRLKANIK